MTRKQDHRRAAERFISRVEVGRYGLNVTVEDVAQLIFRRIESELGALEADICAEMATSVGSHGDGLQSALEMLRERRKALQ